MGVPAERCTDGYEAPRKTHGWGARLGRVKGEETLRLAGRTWEEEQTLQARQGQKTERRVLKLVQCIAQVFAHVCGVGDSQVLIRQSEGVGQMWEHAVCTVGV